jgi:hypothetical protein
MKNLCFMAVLPNWERFHKYNMAAMARERDADADADADTTASDHRKRPAVDDDVANDGSHAVGEGSAALGAADGEGGASVGTLHAAKSARVDSGIGSSGSNGEDVALNSGTNAPAAAKAGRFPTEYEMELAAVRSRSLAARAAGR